MQLADFCVDGCGGCDPQDERTAEVGASQGPTSFVVGARIGDDARASCGIGREIIMGRFVFESSVIAEIEDRLLAHLEFVITSKLRRGEAFTFSWKENADVGGGRTTVWLHPHANIVYRFHGSRSPQLNPVWLGELTRLANGRHGLYIVPEPRGHELPEGWATPLGRPDVLVSIDR
ncbi:hypothetical protein ACIQLJ_01700 [Microbacterium sp. NPDC091313]